MLFADDGSVDVDIPAVSACLCDIVRHGGITECTVYLAGEKQMVGLGVVELYGSVEPVLEEAEIQAEVRGRG